MTIKIAIIGGTKVPILGGTTSLVINASDYGLSSATLSFASAYVLDSEPFSSYTTASNSFIIF